MTAPTTARVRPPTASPVTGAVVGPLASVPSTLRRARIEQVMLAAFIVVPLAAVVAAAGGVVAWAHA